MIEEWFRRLFNKMDEYPKVRVTCSVRKVIIYRTLDGDKYEVEECFEEVTGIKSVKLIKDN